MKQLRFPVLNTEQQAYLNALGEKKPEDCDKNYAAFKRWQNDVLTCLIESLANVPSDESLSEGQELVWDAISAIGKGIRSFDPKLGRLGNYLNHALKTNYRRLLSERYSGPEEADGTPEAGAEPEPEETTVTFTSLSDGGGERGGPTDVPDNTPIDKNLLAEAFLQEMAAMILNFKQIYRGNAGNPRRQRYFRMWYSERMKNLTQQGWTSRETGDLVRALDFDYLDFFLEGDLSAGENRSWSRFFRALPKRAVPVCVSPSPVEVRWSEDGWLPAMIPRGYLGARLGTAPSDSTVSEQRANYINDLKDLFRKHNLV